MAGDDDENRRAIFARRKRFIALALAGTTAATTATACACLSPLPPPDASLDGGSDAARPDASESPADGGTDSR